MEEPCGKAVKGLHITWLLALCIMGDWCHLSKGRVCAPSVTKEGQRGVPSWPILPTRVGVPCGWLCRPGSGCSTSSGAPTPRPALVGGGTGIPACLPAHHLSGEYGLSGRSVHYPQDRSSIPAAGAWESWHRPLSVLRFWEFLCFCIPVHFWCSWGKPHVCAECIARAWVAALVQKQACYWHKGSFSKS